MKLHERWDQETLADAPHRREKLIRMAERHYAKAMAGDTVPLSGGRTKTVKPWTAATAPARLRCDKASLSSITN